MADTYELRDSALESARFSLIRAGGDPTDSAGGVPGPLPSLTGIGVVVHGFLSDLHTGRQALGDAARVSEAQIIEIARASGELDTQLASGAGH